MKTFVLIFRQGPYKFTETEFARRQKDIAAWAGAQNAAGHQLDPRILAPDVLRFGANRSEVTKDEWPLTALLFVEAPDLATAGQIAEAHPASQYNTHVEVRPWTAPVVPAPAAR